MCGIIGYIGRKRAMPILRDGLRRMEYRGYDSAGIAVVSGAEDHAAVKMEKTVGAIARLAEALGEDSAWEGTLGIGHTRWATHGGVTEQNAHPHTDCASRIFVAHNGIIENYRELKEELIKNGHVFRSQTDTEVLPHLIEEQFRTMSGTTFEDAVRVTLQKIQGTYGIAVIDAKNPDTLIAARNFSPLLLGVGDGEYFVASDASAVLQATAKVVYLDDGELAVITRSGYRVFSFDRILQEKALHTIEWTAAEAERGGYPHFMLKEIHAGPGAVENSIRGRLVQSEGRAKLGGLAEVLRELRAAERILIVACGTAYLAGRIGEYMLEEYASIPTEVEIASEFRYRKPVFRKHDIVLAISQSGETADTLAALREAKEKGITTLGIVNVIGSSIARETDAGVYQHVGPEIGVASTKAFVSQTAILALFTILLGRQRDMSLVTGERIGNELKKIPELMRHILQQSQTIKAIAGKYRGAKNFFFLGRKYNLPVAYEGALKLKEISYVHAEGYGAGELKHGPIAMIDERLPSVCLVPQDSMYEKMLSNMEEIRARNGPLIAIATEGDERARAITDDIIYIPKTMEMLTPLLSIVPLQLFAYYFGTQLGYDVDKPRNLAKSVTVE